MKNLNKNESYDIKDLDSDKKDILFKWLEQNDKGWKRRYLDNYSEGRGLCWWISEWRFHGEPTKNALVLFKNNNLID